MPIFDDQGLDAGGVYSTVRLGANARDILPRVLRGEIAPNYAEWAVLRPLLCELAALIERASDITITVHGSVMAERPRW